MADDVTPPLPPRPPVTAGAGTQRLLLPVYKYPGPSLWEGMVDRLYNALVDAVIVLNDSSGQFTKADPNYTRALAYCVKKRQKVIGYVTTRAGSVARTPAAVNADVDRYFDMYPGISGIFFDEASNDPATKGDYLLFSSA